MTPIKTIKVYYLSEEHENLKGLLLGIELLDFNDKIFCSTGDTLSYYEHSEEKQFELKEGERLLGVKYGRREWPNNCYAHDVQFIIGKLSS